MSLNLYLKLLDQLDRDFQKAGIAIDITEAMKPAKLVEELGSVLTELIHNDFQGYLNLLYIVDVPESEMQLTNVTGASEIAKLAAFLLLKREWQKVWMRSRYEGENG